MTIITETRPEIRLLPGRHKRAAAGHPWIYSNEIAMDAAAKALPPGTLVRLAAADGGALGVGFFNPHTLIAARRLSRDPDARIDAAFFAARLERALQLRQRLFAAPYYRLVHAEADGLPGLVVDRFGDVVACQLNTAGMAAREEDIVTALQSVLAPRAVVLRNDSPARATEGLPAETRVAVGAIDGPVTVMEGGLAFHADLVGGQKTGWFFDQRDNRAFIAALTPPEGRVLDLYAFGGGFALACAKAGAAEVVAVDRSEGALALAAASAHDNGLAARCTFRRAEAFAEAARLAQDGARFDVVVADPPAFVKSRKDLASGLKGYRKLARLAATLTAPGGILFIASCSHNVAPEDFAEAVRRGLADAGRDGRILREAGAAPDHPIHPFLPETAYLKSLTLALE